MDRTRSNPALPTLILTLAWLVASSASADVVTLQASKDNTLYQDAAGSLSNGAGQHFFAGNNDNNLPRRGVIAFNLSSIPTGSTITSVTLTLYMSRSRAQNETVTLHRALADWGEGTSIASGEEGGGAPAATGDATWLHRFYNTLFWSTVGGDFSATASASSTVGGQSGSYSWSSTGMATDVQFWLSNPGSNFGWLVRGNESTNKTTKRFDSRQNTTVSRRPVLTVNYTPSAQTTGACCLSDGTCQVLTQTNCTGQGGSYQGDNVSCSPNPCPQSTGACCLSSGVCQIVTQTTCSGQGGTYQGDGTSCSPNPCPQPTGACCLAGGSCAVLTSADCTSQGGLYQGNGASCSPNPCAGSQQVTLVSVKDNTLYQDAAGSLSNGKGIGFFAGKDTSLIRRGVVAFDLTSIPAGATVTGAQLQLYLGFTQSTAADNVTVHRTMATWGEGTSDAAGNESGGAASTVNDATWIHRFYNTTLWSAAGGDFNATASATTSVGTTTGFYTWSSSGLVADVQAWVSTPSTNFGWLLRCNEAVTKSQRRFDTRESATPAQRPMLTVTYTVQAPSGACCFTDGSCQVLTQTNCGTQGGSYDGDGTTCSPNLCPQPTGACCLADGSCQAVTQTSCLTQSGTYQGNGTTCTPNPCPQPTGGCCFADGSCQVLTQTSCGTQGGTYQGNSTTCTPNPCPQPTGACCFNNGTCQVLTQAQCSTQSGTYRGDNAPCTSDLCPVILEPFVDALPIPAVAQPVSGAPGAVAAYEIPIQQVQQQLHRDLPPTTVWGYGGTYPGPTIVASVNNPITVTWTNDLRDESGNLRTTHYMPVDTCVMGATNEPRVIVHLHGGHVPQSSDGYPEDAFLPGVSATYFYPNDQLPATLWYHDHALGITRLNVIMGMAGFYLLFDNFETSLNLPSGPYEIGLAVQDRTFNSDGSFRYPTMWEEHFFGDTILVNGKVWPYLNVAKGKYRFRLLGGSTSRTYTLSLSNGAPITQIGTEGGMLPAPVVLSAITIAPGERADVIIDFAPFAPGTEILLLNSAPAPFPSGDPMHAIPNVMKFIVQNQTGHTAPVPATLRPISTLDPMDAVTSRDMELRKMPAACTGSMWMINGLHWDDITEYPKLGTTEIWRFINRSGVSHPMHMHLVMFQVLDRQGYDIVDGQVVPVGAPTPPPPEEAGWKDTVMCHPEQITRVIAKFEGYAGLYAYHCHILEHEEHEMMRQFRVVLPADLDEDGDVDQDDVGLLRACASRTGVAVAPGCESRDLDGDGDADESDFGLLQRCYSGANLAPPEGCVGG